jgi:hypothetical protein
MVKFIDHPPDVKDRNGEVTKTSGHGNDGDEEVNDTRIAGRIEGEGHRKKRKNKERRSKDGER